MRTKLKKLRWGFRGKPSDFVAAAMKAGHPRFLDYKSIDSIDNLVQSNIDIDAGSLVRDRPAYLKTMDEKGC